RRFGRAGRHGWRVERWRRNVRAIRWRRQLSLGCRAGRVKRRRRQCNRRAGLERGYLLAGDGGGLRDKAGGRRCNGQGGQTSEDGQDKRGNGKKCWLFVHENVISNGARRLAL